MTTQEEGMRAQESPPSQQIVRPVGTWVIAGVLLAYILVAWGLVSLVFLHRA